MAMSGTKHCITAIPSISGLLIRLEAINQNQTLSSYASLAFVGAINIAEANRISSVASAAGN